MKHLFTLLTVLFSVVGIAIPVNAMVTERSDILVIAGQFQTYLATNYLTVAQNIEGRRQNVIAASKIIDPAKAAIIYQTPLSSSAIVSAVRDPIGKGWTVVSYNPVYDVAWIYHFIYSGAGRWVTIDHGVWDVDGLLLVTGGFWDDSKLADVPAWMDDPDWIAAKNIGQITNSSLKITSKHLGFSEIMEYSDYIFQTQREAADKHVINFLGEQIQAGRAGSYDAYPDLIFANQAMDCIHKQPPITGSLKTCLMPPNALADLTTVELPEHLDAEAYKKFLTSASVIGSYTNASKQNVILIAGHTPLENQFALIVVMHDGATSLIDLVPYIKKAN